MKYGFSKFGFVFSVLAALIITVFLLVSAVTGGHFLSGPISGQSAQIYPIPHVEGIASHFSDYLPGQLGITDGP